MNDKLVTHADLQRLRDLREIATEYPIDTVQGIERVALLDRLIAAAEADAPPLPEGWVVLDDDKGEQTVYWHERGRLFVYRSSILDRDGLAAAAFARDRLTPLRPTVTEADVEKAARALYGVEYPEDGWPEWAGDQAKAATIADARKAFAAVGIEVQS